MGKENNTRAADQIEQIFEQKITTAGLESLANIACCDTDDLITRVRDEKDIVGKAFNMLDNLSISRPEPFQVSAIDLVFSANEPIQLGASPGHLIRPSNHLPLIVPSTIRLTDRALLLYRRSIDMDDKRGNADFVFNHLDRPGMAQRRLEVLAGTSINLRIKEEKLRKRDEEIKRSGGSYESEKYMREYDQLQSAYIARLALIKLGVDLKKLDERAKITAQLDWEIFPPESLIDIANHDIERMGIDREDVDMEKLKLIEDLALTKGIHTEVYRSRMGFEPIPYYAVILESVKGKLAVAESPVYGNATYLLREDYTPGTWQEVFALYKKDAREIGAIQIVHPKFDNPNRYQDHRQEVFDTLSELLQLPPASKT